MWWDYEKFIRPTIEVVYDVLLNEKGQIIKYSIIDENDQAKGTKWYVYSAIAGKHAWYNNQAYIDILDEKAVKTFTLASFRLCQSLWFCIQESTRTPPIQKGFCFCCPKKRKNSWFVIS